LKLVTRNWKLDTAMKNIGILYHPLNSSARSVAEDLKSTLSGNGISTWSCSAWDEAAASCLIDGTDLLLSIGGDGTILHAAQIALGNSIPITGINMGNLGFMTEFSVSEAKTGIFEIIAGKGWLDKRAMLEAVVPGQDRPVYYALNDIVLARGAVARMVSIKTELDDVPFITYRADGVILSTATGSTGYSLAAGGPILDPASTDFVMTPVLTHLSLPYSMVLPAATKVKLLIKTPFPATLNIDGHTNLTVSGDTEITVKRSDKNTGFLRIKPKNNFYNTLEQKLKGKQTR
jgi:NAD+ kinase